MNYFLVQPENQLIHLPDCRIEEGKPELMEVGQIGGPPIFLQGRKRPDLCVFTVPSGVPHLAQCLIVDEDGLVRRILVSTTEIAAHALLAAGVVEEQFPAPLLKDAKEAITKKLEELKTAK